jgi:hypothetical protein
MEAVIQIHGFKSNDNEFILKEFAVVGKTYRTHVLFKSPYPYNTLNSKMQRTARWLTRHYHRITWEDGDTVYSKELISSLCKPFNVIYTKGTEKAKFLRQFHDNVIEIDEGLHVNSITSGVTCMLPCHNKDSVRCALNSAVLYAQRLL